MRIVVDFGGARSKRRPVSPVHDQVRIRPVATPTHSTAFHDDKSIAPPATA